jgi:hypothetical protein
MKSSALILFIFFSLKGNGQIQTYPGTNVDFTEEEADSISIKLDSILIVGMGTSLTRIFLEDVGNEMIKKFHSVNISASYFYLGNNVEEANKEFDLIDKKGYKAILFFLPTDTAFFDSELITMGSNTNEVLVYQQTFEFKLCQIKPGMKKFWNAFISIDCDPSRKRGAKNLSNKLATRFYKKGYIDNIP